MKLYLSIIGFAVAVISALNIALGACAWYYAIIATVWCTALQFALDGTIAILIKKMPEAWFGVENRLYHVSDFEKSLKFYTEGLGFTVYRSWIAGSGKKIALLDMGNGNCIELFSDGEKAEYPAEPAGSYFHLALKTDDAKEAYEKAIAYGAPSHKAPDTYALPAQPPINAIIAFVKGPDGELVEFFQELD